MATPDTAKIPATAAAYVANTIQTRGGCARSGAPSARMPHAVDGGLPRAREEEEQPRREQHEVEVPLTEGLAGALDGERDDGELHGNEETDPATKQSDEQRDASRHLEDGDARPRQVRDGNSHLGEAVGDLVETAC